MTAPSAVTQVSASTWFGFGMMCVGMFMAILDVQVVATSLPTIQRALDIRLDQMSWIQTAYLIAEVIAIPLTGFLTRTLTVRWLFVVSVTIFTLASIACAASNGFVSLIFWRLVQGFAGGTLIPAVFAAVFLFFPYRLQGIATTIAGVVAVMAPTVGPIVGGWLTDTYSWHWLFLINVLPGVLCALFAIVLLPKEKPDLAQAREIDVVSLGLMTFALTALEIAIKEAPERGWASWPVVGLLALSLLSGAQFVARMLQKPRPFVQLRAFRDRSFTVGCVLSFILGIGLFGSVYLMPIFLAFVRGHGALDIGKIMLVTGLAQFLTAPIAVALERRYDGRILTALGFLFFGIGLGLSCVQTGETDFDQMLLPQIIRGVSVMFCILPPTRFALGQLSKAAIPDASGLFNLMRNLGGAIGIALIDTIIYARIPVQVRHFSERLARGDLDAASTVGIPLDLFKSFSDPAVQSSVAPLLQKAAYIQAINDAWAMIALLTLAALVCVPFARTVTRFQNLAYASKA